MNMLIIIKQKMETITDSQPSTLELENRTELRFPSDNDLEMAIVGQFNDENVNSSLVEVDHSSGLPAEGRLDVVANVYDTGELSVDDKRELVAKALERTVLKAVRGAWWNIVNRELSGDMARTEDDEMKNPEAFKVTQVHEFTVVTPEGVDGKYQVIEAGEAEDAMLTEAELMAVEKSLVTIDQLSGGAIALDDSASRIIIVAEDAERIGFPGEYGTVMNMREIRRIAGERGIDLDEMITAVLFHEVLGHHVDRLLDGENPVFEEFFEYSKEMIPGDKAGRDVHAEITPKDLSAEGSEAVGEYGRTSASEDFATAAEVAVVASVMPQYEESISAGRGIVRKPDSYRTDLVMNAFNRVAAEVSKENEGGAEDVGIHTPVSVQKTPRGLAVVPGRTLVHTTKSPETYIEEEVGNFVRNVARPTEVLFTAPYGVL